MRSEEISFPTLDLCEDYLGINLTTSVKIPKYRYSSGYRIVGLDDFFVKKNLSLLKARGKLSGYTKDGQFVTPITGFDLPLMIHPKKNKHPGHIVFIIGKQALRNQKFCKQFMSETDFDKNVIVGGTFAQDISWPFKRRIYDDIIDYILEKGYQVYLTNHVKAWQSVPLYDGKTTETCSENHEIRWLFDDLLDLEVGYMRGIGKSIDLVLSMSSNTIVIRRLAETGKAEIAEVAYIPHPSGANNRAWKAIEVGCSNAEKLQYIKGIVDTRLGIR